MAINVQGFVAAQTPRSKGIYRQGYAVGSPRPLASPKPASLWGRFRGEGVANFFIEHFGCRATQADGAALERSCSTRVHR